MKKSVKGIVCGLGAGAAYLIFYLFLDLSLILSLIIAVLVYAGLNLVTAPAKETLIIETAKVGAEEFAKTIKDGKEKIRFIRDTGKTIKNEEVRLNIEKICKVMDDIFVNVEKDPKDIRLARKFLDYYLDAAKRIVELYYELSKKEIYTDQEKEILAKAEKMLEQIEATFHQQLGKLQEGDYLDLSTELEVLETTMKLEGV